MDTKTIGKWLYLGGMLVAIIVALFEFSADWLTMVLMAVGVLAGIFYSTADNVSDHAIRYLGLVAVAAALDGFVGVGEYITTIMEATIGFLGPVLLTTLVMWFIKKTTSD